MAEVFLHGLETQESDAGNPRYVGTIDSGVIFFVGTAPSADDDLFPYNEPKLILGYNDLPIGLGADGTIPDQLNRIFDQAGRSSATVVFTRVEEGVDAAATLVNVLGNRTNRTGLHSLSRVESELHVRPKLLMAPGFTSTRATNGITSIPLSSPGAGYDPLNPPSVTITRSSVATADTTGYGASAHAIVNQDGTLDSIVIDNGGALWTKPLVTIEAPPAGGTAATVGTVVMATTANPVAMELVQLGNRYRAMVAVTGPNTNRQDAVTYRLDFDTDRIYIIDPMGKFAKGGVATSMPAEGAMLGMQSRIDYEEGFWVSPSNHVMEGLLGTHRPIEHSLNDRSSESQYLNKNHIGTLVRAPSGGWKLFGNRVAKSDPLHVFWSVRRAHDIIIDSIELASEPYLDKPFTQQALVDIAETVNRAMRRWTALGATLGGRVWLDPNLNTPESMSSGIIYIHYDGEAPAPMEHIIFVFNRNTGYYRTVFDAAAREIARQSSLVA
jgi:phage tail sheath protein FI